MRKASLLRRVDDEVRLAANGYAHAGAKLRSIGNLAQAFFKPAVMALDEAVDIDTAGFPAER